MSEDNDLGYGYCPLQIEGKTHNGMDYYFRARGRSWTLQIGETPEQDAVRAPVFMSGHIDSNFVAGWMPHELAKALTDWALRCYAQDHPIATPAAARDG